MTKPKIQPYNYNQPLLATLGELKHVSLNPIGRFLPAIYPLNARWPVHSLILSSQPNFGQIAKSGPPLCQFILKGTKSGQSGPESTITP